MQKIKAILFDLDGVLVDACEWHYHALNMALKENGCVVISRKDHENKFNGSPTRVKLDMLAKDGLLDRKLIEKIWKDKQTFTIESIKKNSATDQEKILMHEQLKSVEYKIGCVTNSIKKTANLMLEATGQKDFMDIIITNEDVINPKPSAECYIKAMSLLDVHPRETLIIEDSEKGYKAAISSGAHVMKVSGPDIVTINSISYFLNTAL